MDLSDDTDPSAPTGAPLVPGYSMGARIGTGGSAVVWAATRERDGVPVAVKVVTVGGEDHAEAAVRELGVLGRVEVEGLVRFHEAVAIPGEQRRVALVLDHVAGGSLLRVVRARGHLSVGESVTVLAPVARALAGLHAAGVVHGDVTPGNVLVERSGRPLLADLGVARLVGEVPGEAVGTEGFVAPEVLDGAPVTAAADVYAAGALAWWCVTGEVPGSAAWRQPLESLAPGLPAAWRETTLRALAGDPSVRPSAAEIALAWFDSAECEPLRLVVGRDDTSLLTHRLRRAVPEAVEPEPTTRRERLARAARSSRRFGMPRWRGAAARGSRKVPRPRIAAALTGAGLATLLVAGALMAAGRRPAPAWLAPTRDSASTVPVARSSPTTVTAAASSAASPTRDPVALLQELADLRARAMVSGDAADLKALDAPGSGALASDTADLRRVAQARLTYEGVRLTVRSARAVAATERAATVEAVVDTAAYRVVAMGDGRSTRTEKAVPGAVLRFALVWSGERWLIDRVDPGG